MTMPIPSDSDLKVVGLVLTKDQVERMNAYKRSLDGGHRRVSLSDVGREVVEAGLQAILRAPNITIGTSTEKTSDDLLAVAS